MSKRLNLCLPETTIDRIENVKNLTMSPSVTDVVRSAIITYEALVEFMADGNKFYIKKPGTDNFQPVKFMFDVQSLSK